MLGCLPSAVIRVPIEDTVVDDRDLVHVTMVYLSTVADWKEIMKCKIIIFCHKSYIT